MESSTVAFQWRMGFFSHDVSPVVLLPSRRFVSELEVDLDRGLYVIIPLCKCLD